MYRLIRQLQLVDRRLVYFVIVLVLSVPFVFSYTLPIYPDTYTRRFFDQIEQIANDPVEREKVVMLLANWGPGTRGENEPQFKIIARHLLRRELKFVIVCTMGPPEFHDAIMAAFERAQEEERAWARRQGLSPPTWVYGEDYLDFGYKNAIVFHPVARTVVTEPRAFFKQDYRFKKDLTEDSSFPLLEDFDGPEDISAVVVVSHADESKYIAGLVKSEYPDLRIGHAAMGIEANKLYPFVKSGQLFGLINSARGATEYRALLNPDEPTTTAKDNSMSLGKTLLLLLVLMGNVAFITTRWAERSGRLTPLDPREIKPPLSPLPRWLMWSLFGLFVAFYGGSVIYATVKYMRTDALPRVAIGGPTDMTQAGQPTYERVGLDELEAETRSVAEQSPNPLLAELSELEAKRRYYTLIEARIGEFMAAFFTLGVFAFLLGDNRFYRVIEAVIMGGSLAYMLDQIDKIIRPDFVEPVVAGVTGQAHWSNVLWLLLLVPGALWYFTYSKKYRWLNQLVVAVFIGLMVGPEFRNQINIIIPQVLDTIRPIWPWALDPATGASTFQPSRVEHFVFVLMALLSLAYFIFFLRPKTAAGRSTLAAGRFALMIGFGVGFGNTVNTRLSWLADRIAFLIQDWLGKLLAA